MTIVYKATFQNGKSYIGITNDLSKIVGISPTYLCNLNRVWDGIILEEGF